MEVVRRLNPFVPLETLAPRVWRVEVLRGNRMNIYFPRETSRRHVSSSQAYTVRYRIGERIIYQRWIKTEELGLLTERWPFLLIGIPIKNQRPYWNSPLWYYWGCDYILFLLPLYGSFILYKFYIINFYLTSLRQISDSLKNHFKRCYKSRFTKLSILNRNFRPGEG